MCSISEAHEAPAQLTVPVPCAERHTAPAPEMHGASTDVPSARPTSVPETFDAQWLDAGLARGAIARGIPRDLVVPTRVPGASVAGIHLREAFLLLHVDGRSSIDEIAYAAGLPLVEVMDAFLELVTLGCVELSGTSHTFAPPESGTFPKLSRADISALDAARRG